MSRKRTVNIGTAKMVYLYESSIGRGICLLQRRLAEKAIREPEHRFDDLYNLTYNPKWVEASLKLVLSNQGSKTAGIDGITKQHLKDDKNKEALALYRSGGFQVRMRSLWYETRLN